MDYLQNGVPVRFLQKGEERSAICYLVDYKNQDNNSFIVANQWIFIENSKKRPDVILLIYINSRTITTSGCPYCRLKNYT